MNQLMRYYNQNRKKIWGIVIIIASAFLLLQLVNHFYKVENQKKLEGNSKRQEEPSINTNTTILTENQSVVTGKKVETKKLETATNLIDEFISYCNNKEIEKAYELLTEQCKEQIYSNLEIFEQAYVNNVFEGKQKKASIENWYDNIYKVKIMEDMLSTGKSDGKTKQDYMTIIEENEEYKLNINGYIGKTIINRTTEKDDIKIEVVNKNTYKEYEEYTIKVTNHTENIILLDGRTDAKTLYLQDSKGVTYSSYSHELTEPMLTIEQGKTKEITIKFYSTFISNKKIEAIVFSDLILRNGQLTEKIEFRAEV